MEATKKHSKFKLFFNKIKTYFSKPANIITVIFVILLTATVVLPLISLVRDAFIIHVGGEAREYQLPVGTYTMAHWKYLLFNKEHDFSRNFFWKPLLNSLSVAVIACIVSLTGGATLAFLITRTNMPFKKFISVLFIFPYIMPTWSIAMFWENFFKNSTIIAASNQVGILEALTGITVPETMVYGLIPIAMCLGIHYAPFAYIFVGGILRNMEANLEEAATILKASRMKIIRKITFPMVLPGIISTVLLVFASSMSSYTVPVFLNKHGRFPTVSTSMQSLLNGSTTKGMGFSVALILILFSVSILLFNARATGKRKSFATVHGKSGQVSLIDLKKFKYPIGVIFAGVVAFFAFVPLITFGLESLLHVPGDYSTLTTYYWTTTDQIERRIAGSSAGILRNPTIWGAMGKSLLLSILVAFVAGTFGILIGYAVAHKRTSKVARYVSNLAFFPYLIPSLSFGALYFSLSFMDGFSWLNGTFLLLVIVGSIKFLPFASRTGTNAMMQLSGEIEEAGIIIGVPWWKRMTQILFPIQKASFISGYLLPFMSVMRELSLFILIAGAGSLITVVMQNYDLSGVYQISNGINFLIMIVIIVVNFSINKITGASIDKGVGA